MLPSNRRILENFIIIFVSVALQNELTVFRATALVIPEGLRDGSICKTHHRVGKTRLKSYHETYRQIRFFSEKTKTRLNWMTEQYWTWEEAKICCEGYEPYENNGSFDACKPVCKSGCENGSCLGPNMCHCNVSYEVSINTITGYSECVPYCRSGCQGGQCQAPNVCACLPGYVSSPDRASCEASCAGINSGDFQDCGSNATCIAPNICKCDDGYTVIENSTIIDLSIAATDSLSPDNKNFTAGGVICKPFCESGCKENASCVAPNTCECDSGYVSESLTDRPFDESPCLPVCAEPCVNAFCSHPNVCTCLQGYKPHSEDSFSCKPICNDECINAICTRPDNCECKDGYEKVLTLKSTKNVCGPICPDGCRNGNCIAPGLCSCNKGYTLSYRSIDDERTKDSDINGTDIYVKPSNVSSREFCQPICRTKCPNGSSCIAPDKCQLQLRTIYTDIDCDNNGITSKENGTCLCNYGWSGSRCNEATFCGIVITDDNSVNDDFVTLNRVYYPDKWDWKGPKCRETCVNSLLTLISSANHSDTAAYHCYHLVLYEKTIGLVSDQVWLSDIIDRENKTIFCIITIDSSCNAIKSSIKRVVIVSLAFFLAAACALGLYVYRRELRSITIRSGAVKIDDTIETAKDEWDFE